MVQFCRTAETALGISPDRGIDDLDLFGPSVATTTTNGTSGLPSNSPSLAPTMEESLIPVMDDPTVNASSASGNALQEKELNLGLVIGLSAGLFVLLVLPFAVGYLVYKNMSGRQVYDLYDTVSISPTSRRDAEK